MRSSLLGELAATYARVRERCAADPRFAASARHWLGARLPADATDDALAEAITFGVLVAAPGLDEPWREDRAGTCEPWFMHLARACDPWLMDLARAFEPFAFDPASSAPVYDAFLGQMRPNDRRAHGVFFTSPELASAQVRLAADVLSDRLGCAGGLADREVLLIDPAAGEGVYPLAALAHANACRPPRSPSECGAPGTPSQCGAPASPRIVAFEPRVGAATLLRARLRSAGLADADVRLEDALSADFSPSAPIVICIGNPPYGRGPASPSARLDAFQPTAAGVHAKNLYNAYIYFWRWALQTVFEQRTGPGIVSFVTPTSFLTGPGFSGVRAALRRSLDDIWVLDLGGEGRGPRLSDNVFGEIRSPVAVTMGVRSAAAGGGAARVWHARLEGTRSEKLNTLASVRSVDDIAWQAVDRQHGAPMRARHISSYHAWPRLTDLFPVQLSGCQMKRTWPIGPTREVLVERWRHLLKLDADERERAFRRTRDRTCRSTPPTLLENRTRDAPLADLPADAASPTPTPYAYRSFDRQWLLADTRLGDFMRPALWRTAGPRQIFLTSLLAGVLGSGPAAVATALVPDLDHFRGSFGGRAVVPLWLDFEATRPNVDPHQWESLCATLGTDVCAEDLLAYAYALLGSTAYTARFAEELLEPGPRVALTRSPALFARGVELGRELLWLHTFGARIFSHRPLRGAAACIAPPSVQPASFHYDEQRHELHIGDGLFGPVEPNVWRCAVSGLQVMRSWLTYRIRPAKRRSELDSIRPTWTDSMSSELLEVIWVLEATLALQPALATLLDEVVA